MDIRFWLLAAARHLPFVWGRRAASLYALLTGFRAPAPPSMRLAPV